MDWTKPYIGSHDSGAILGDSLQSSARKVYEQKTGRLEAKADYGILADFGLFAEPFVLERYEETLAPNERLITGYSSGHVGVLMKRKLAELVDTSTAGTPKRYWGKLHLKHRKFDWLRGSPDGLVANVESGRAVRGVDAKVVFDWNAAHLIQEGGLRPKDEAQGRHFCKLTGLKKWDFIFFLACSFGKIVTITYHDDGMGCMDDATYYREMTNFWKRVENREPPEYTGLEGKDAPSMIALDHSGKKYAVDASEKQIDLAFHAIRQQAISKDADREYRKACGRLSDSMPRDTDKLLLDGKSLVSRSKVGSMLFGKDARREALSSIADTLDDGGDTYA